MTATALPRRPRAGQVAALLLGLAALLAVFGLPLDFTWLSSAAEVRAAGERFGAFVFGLAAPDLSRDMLARCGRLLGDTVAIAVLGTAGGLLLAYPLAVASCRSVVLADAAGSRALPRRLVLELARLALDVLRGVPDFVWAVLLANVTGMNAVTGTLAIALSVGGILGKVLGEQWDNVAPQRYEALRSTGASPLQVFLYGIQPLGVRATTSFVLMRFECAVRNASVIGVVGGGGLGAAFADEFTDGDWRGVATVLLTLLVLTAGVDLAANVLRRRLRAEPDGSRRGRSFDLVRTQRRRRQVGFAVAAVLAASAWWLAAPFAQAARTLAGIEWGFVRSYTLGMFAPSLSPTTWLAVVAAAGVPLAIGCLATLGGGALAALGVYPASLTFQLDAARFTGERAGRAVRSWRALQLVVARGTALLLRGIPEVAWLFVLAVLMRDGPLPCVAAIALHSAGVLHRVFTEATDDVAHARLERVGAGRAATFAYGALPAAVAQWRTYLFFPFEVNVRAGVALGVVGAGGLGQAFRHNLAFREHADAAAFLWGMVLLTIAIDRLSRRLQLRRLRC